MQLENNAKLFSNKKNIDQKKIQHDINDQNNVNNSGTNTNKIDTVKIKKLFSKSNNNTLNQLSVNSIENNLSTTKSIHTSSRIISTSSVDNESPNKFNSKVILEKIPSVNECIYLLENYLTENNINSKYQTSYEKNKIIFTFNDEKIAFNFTKIIYNEKNNNPLYKDVKVYYSLNPNQDFMNNNQKILIKKKGISADSIEKLFRGDRYKKIMKPVKERLGDFYLGMSSPFYTVDKKNKMNKNHVFLSANRRKNSKKILILNRNINSGERQQPLKDYNKLRINVLDTHYNPISNFLFRDVDKNKWVSPNNFKCY